jgi:hypothetical protein
MTVITPCRPAEPHEIPKTAKALADAATANGWDVEITYARHWAEKARPPKAVDSIAVRMWRETRLAGIWYGGKFESGLVPYRRVSAATLGRIVRMSRPELREFAQGLTEEVAA